MSFILTILQYFFDPLPPGPFKFMYVFIALAGLCFLGAIGLKVFLKQQKEDKIFKKLFRDLPGKLLVIGTMEGLYVLVRYERMPYLSMRFINDLILAYALYVVVRYVQMYFKIYPAEKKHHEHQLKMNKYLPRKGGKKH